MNTEGESLPLLRAVHVGFPKESGSLLRFEGQVELIRIKAQDRIFRLEGMEDSTAYRLKILWCG